MNIYLLKRPSTLFSLMPWSWHIRTAFLCVYVMSFVLAYKKPSIWNIMCYSLVILNSATRQVDHKPMCENLCGGNVTKCCVFTPFMLGILMVQWKSDDFRKAIPQYLKRGSVSCCTQILYNSVALIVTLIISLQRSQKEVLPCLVWDCEETLTGLADESCPGSQHSTMGVKTKYNPHIIWYRKLYNLDHRTNTSYVACEEKKNGLCKCWINRRSS